MQGLIITLSLPPLDRRTSTTGKAKAQAKMAMPRLHLLNRLQAGFICHHAGSSLCGGDAVGGGLCRLHTTHAHQWHDNADVMGRFWAQDACKVIVPRLQAVMRRRSGSLEKCPLTTCEGR